MPDTTPLIDATGLCRDYGALRAVDAVDLRLERGEIVGLLGQNGAGKTSTMDMLCGVLAPTAGAIAIDGIDLLEEPRRAKRALGYLPEQPPLYPDMSVRGYLAFAAALHGVHRAGRRDATDRAMALCGLTDVARRPIGNLSKGYRQRVGIAQAIVHDPAAIVLDEPTVGLDPIQIRAIRALIADLGREHGIILSTHILPEVQALCSRVAIMHHGRILHGGPVSAFTDEAASDRITVTLRRAPVDAEIRAIEGVTDIEHLGPGRLRLRLDPTRGTPSGSPKPPCTPAGGWSRWRRTAPRWSSSSWNSRARIRRRRRRHEDAHDRCP
ncbi:MAG: ABC transporter ATP-binding protein [Halofilum sp. (in: g-proteobacteria)]|nr:ABC transporter ATP-binding protein [Halofilum sp. (in: g-proteobacteria)]